MNKEEFDHGIRAAGSILGVNEVLVIGSQAAHGSVPGDLPPEALRSVEVDIAAFDDPDGVKADLLDGAIGEASLFQREFGFYVDGVTLSTAILPRRLARPSRSVRDTCNGGRRGVVPGTS